MPNLPFGCGWFLDIHCDTHCVTGRPAASKTVLPCRDLGKCFWLQILKEIEKPNKLGNSSLSCQKIIYLSAVAGERLSYPGGVLQSGKPGKWLQQVLCFPQPLVPAAHVRDKSSTPAARPALHRQAARTACLTGVSPGATVNETLPGL